MSTEYYNITSCPIEGFCLIFKRLNLHKHFEWNFNYFSFNIINLYNLY